MMTANPITSYKDIYYSKCDFRGVNILRICSDLLLSKFNVFCIRTTLKKIAKSKLARNFLSLWYAL